VTIMASSIKLVGNVVIGGTLTCPSITTLSITSATYSPGVGNLI
jgi:hypothetical protein